MMNCRLIFFKQAGRLLVTAALFSTLLLGGPAPSVVAQEQGETREPTIGERSRGEARSVSAEQSVVEWDKAIKYPRLDVERLSESQRRSVRRAPVPVLLPDRDDLLQAAEITTGGYFYAAQMHKEDISVFLNGASKVIRARGAPEPPALGDPELTVKRGEGIVRLSFKAFGVHYDLEVSCPDPDNDSRCAEDAYVLDLADHLLLVVAGTRIR